MAPPVSEPPELGVPRSAPPPARVSAPPPVPDAQAANGPEPEEPPLDAESMAAVLRGADPKQVRSARSLPKRPRAPAGQPAATASRAPAAPAAKRPAGKKPVLPKRPVPDFSGLPPAMAQSLARLAGVPWPPPEGASGDGGEDARQLEDEGASSGKTGR